MLGPGIIFGLTVVIEGSMGIGVKKALVSNNVIMSPSSSFTFWMCSTKCWMFLRWCGDWPTKGRMMLASSLVTPYVMDPLLDTMGLRGVSTLYFGKVIRFRGNCTDGIHFPVTVVTESFLVFNVPKCKGKFSLDLSFC